MTKINLREHYPNFYKNDCIIEVPDEVAAIMLEYDRQEAAYRRPISVFPCRQDTLLYRTYGTAW